MWEHKGAQCRCAEGLAARGLCVASSVGLASKRPLKALCHKGFVWLPVCPVQGHPAPGFQRAGPSAYQRGHPYP